MGVAITRGRIVLLNACHLGLLNKKLCISYLWLWSSGELGLEG